MRYIPGGTLKMKLGHPMHWAEAAKLLAPIAHALEYAHQRKMIHRDIKPANVLLTETGYPMLSDFGIAKVLEGSDDAGTLTGTGVGIGTPEYMAPEQGTGKDVDYRADVYSLGVVFYELVTGRKPYIADTPLAVLIKQASEPLPRPKQFVPNLPDSVEKIIFKAMAKKPGDRYQSMGDFALALESLQTGKSTQIKKGETQLSKAKGRLPAWVWVAGGLVLAGIILAAFALTGGTSSLADARSTPASVAPASLSPQSAVAVPTSLISAVTIPPPPATTNRSKIALNNVDRLTQVSLIDAAAHPQSITFSPDGQMLAAGLSDKTVRLWRVADRYLLRTLQSHTENVNSVSFSPDGKLLASASDDNTVRIWQVSDGALLFILQGHTSDVNSVAFSPDGKLLASGGADSTIRLWRPTDGAFLREIQGSILRQGRTPWITALAFSPDGQTLSAGFNDWAIRLWRIPDGSLVREMKAHGGDVNSIAFVADGQTIFSASNDQTLIAWRVSDGSALYTVTGHANHVSGVVVSPNRDIFVSSSWDKTIRLWQVSDGKPLRRIEVSTVSSVSVDCVAFSPAGDLIAAGSDDGSIRFFGIQP
jgi:WD40 repeat protein